MPTKINIIQNTNELLSMIITFVNCHTISCYVWPVHFIWWHAQNVRCEDGDHSEIISYYSTYNLHVPEQRSKCRNLVIFLNMKYQVNSYAILLWETYILQFIFFTFVLGFPNKRRFRGNTFLLIAIKKKRQKLNSSLIPRNFYSTASRNS